MKTDHVEQWYSPLEGSLKRPRVGSNMIARHEAYFVGKREQRRKRDLGEGDLLFHCPRDQCDFIPIYCRSGPPFGPPPLPPHPSFFPLPLLHCIAPRTSPRVISLPTLQHNIYTKARDCSRHAGIPAPCSTVDMPWVACEQVFLHPILLSDGIPGVIQQTTTGRPQAHTVTTSLQDPRRSERLLPLYRRRCVGLFNRQLPLRHCRLLPPIGSCVVSLLCSRASIPALSQPSSGSLLFREQEDLSPSCPLSSLLSPLSKCQPDRSQGSRH